MDLYILRHGKAGQPADSLNDSARPLTSEGRKEIRKTALFLRKKKIRFDIIATSPLLRARETAGIVAREVGEKEDPVIWDELSPGGDPDTLCYHVSQYGEDAVVLVVGHEPLLSGLIGRIITGGGSASVALGKGGLAKIRDFSFEHSLGGGLQWLLTSWQMAEMK